MDCLSIDHHIQIPYINDRKIIFYKQAYNPLFLYFETKCSCLSKRMTLSGSDLMGLMYLLYSVKNVAKFNLKWDKYIASANITIKTILINRKYLFCSMRGRSLKLANILRSQCSSRSIKYVINHMHWIKSFMKSIDPYCACNVRKSKTIELISTKYLVEVIYSRNALLMVIYNIKLWIAKFVIPITWQLKSETRLN